MIMTTRCRLILWCNKPCLYRLSRIIHGQGGMHMHNVRLPLLRSKYITMMLYLLVAECGIESLEQYPLQQGEGGIHLRVVQLVLYDVTLQVVIFGVFFILGHVAGGVVSTFYATEVSGPDDVQNGLIAAAVSYFASIAAHIANNFYLYQLCPDM